MPEARVQQVQHRVLLTADVQVHAADAALLAGPQPVLLVLGPHQDLVVGGVDVAQVVPGGARPLRHRVGLAQVGLRPLAEVQLHLDPVLGARERGLRLGVGVHRVEGLRGEVRDLRQVHRQHRLRQRDRGLGIRGVVDDREGLAPVALPGEQPVPQTVGGAGPAEALLLGVGGGARLRLVLVQAVQIQLRGGGVDLLALAGPGAALEVLRRADGADHGQLEAVREREVALVLGGHGHDRAGAVAHQHVVGGEDGQLAAVHRVRREQPGEHAGLLAALLGALVLVQRGGARLVGGDGLAGGRGAAGPGLVRVLGPRLRQGGDVRQQGVLGGEDAEGRAEQGVGARGEHVEAGLGRVGEPRDGEGDLGAVAAADPVALHGADRLGPVHPVQVIDQAVAVGGDAHVPLAQATGEDGEVAALGAALGGDLLVGQHRAQSGAPVHGSLGDVGQAEAVGQLRDLRIGGAGDLGGAAALPGGGDLQALPVGEGEGIDRAGTQLLAQLGDRPGAPGHAVGVRGVRVVPGVEDAQKDPLRPLHELGVRGRERAARVMGQAQPVQLAAHVRDVRLGGGARMGAGLDGVLLGGQAEGVVAHRVQHVLAEHALVTGDHVGRDVAQRVADVQPRPRGVGEHVHDVHLLGRGGGGGGGLLERGGGAAQLADGVVGVEGALLVPALLPAQLDLVRHRGRVPVGCLAHGWIVLRRISAAGAARQWVRQWGDGLMT